MIIQEGKEILASDRSNIFLRCLSGIVLVILFISAIFLFKPLFYVLMMLIAVGMLNEWYNITNSSIKDLLVGLVVIPISVTCIMLLNYREDMKWLMAVYFSVIWSVDTFAMIGGRIIGGVKLAPKISPKKTWSGLVTGVLAASCIAYLISKFPDFYIDNYCLSKPICLSVKSGILAVVAQLSDLFVSYFKRKFAIKDSGDMIPGHGGVLDRFDSIILSAPLLFVYLSLC